MSLRPITVRLVQLECVLDPESYLCTLHMMRRPCLKEAHFRPCFSGVVSLIGVVYSCLLYNTCKKLLYGFSVLGLIRPWKLVCYLGQCVNS